MSLYNNNRFWEGEYMDPDDPRQDAKKGTMGSSFSDPYAQPGLSPLAAPSGRSYMDPARAQERKNRMDDRFARRSLANFDSGMGGGGGGQRGGGGGGGAMMPPVQQPAPIQRKPNQPWLRPPLGTFIPGQGTPRLMGNNINIPTQLADAATVGFGAAPSLGMDHAQAQARIQNGLGTPADFALIQQQGNPHVGSEINSAKARQLYRRYAMGGPNSSGLMGAAQQALYS